MMDLWEHGHGRSAVNWDNLSRWFWIKISVLFDTETKRDGKENLNPAQSSLNPSLLDYSRLQISFLSKLYFEIFWKPWNNFCLQARGSSCRRLVRSQLSDLASQSTLHGKILEREIVQTRFPSYRRLSRHLLLIMSEQRKIHQHPYLVDWDWAVDTEQWDINSRNSETSQGRTMLFIFH